MILDVLAGTMMTVGCVLAVVATIGLQRFPDVFARMHAATKPATLGLALVLLGAALVVPDPGSRAKLVLVVILQTLTAPVGSHLVGRAAYRAGTELSEQTLVDELRDAVDTTGSRPD
ncbi:monovalent cation/H(+) antiporter subunit G [Salsipaludibacter albus]|uniref:monovalent cation/H(+) antiporter subunit G n=1 Tax=Salsipaludibacter albus TaxID=2849650 RepID=UPI001EE4430F|nr:monovalent cation/H(+) antiporter subunit G [Salsipaludibacter albus]MBY5162639.1 monovalent cation/H(+) antiporter subunit G [Salsipaludibacter albus]